MLAEEQLLRL
jgi:hypothetical protein